MNKKHLTVFIIGVLVAVCTMVLFYSGNNPKSSDTTYAKAEFYTKDDPFARIEYERRMLADPVTGEIPENIRTKEVQFASNLPTVESVSLNKGNLATWTMRGPINRGGRTRALGIDVRTQTAPNITIIAGGASGGIYKSIDNGVTWVNKLSPGLIHSISCLVQDTRPGQENTWYAGTGEALGTDFNGQSLLRGDGVYKSADNGETWALLPSTSDGNVQSFNTMWRYVNNIAVNKSTGSIFAAASNVVMRSQDGGSNWNTVRSTLANNTMSDVQVTTTGVIYAGIPSAFTDPGISTSADDGATWTDITPGGFPANYGRIVIAIAPSNENILYVWTFTGAGATQTQLWKYDASTTNWTNLTANLPATVAPVAGINVQFSYNMVLKVRPDDANFVAIGATNLYRTTDGFSTQVTASGWIGGYATANNISQYANHHPDNHSLVFLNPPNSNVLYSGHDGGISKTDDVTQTPVTWTDLGRGYITSQFFSLAIDPVTANDKVIAGGMQDNGNYTTFSGDFNTDWVDWNHGGDGAFAEVRKTSATSYTIYLEAQNGWLWRQQYNSNGTITADDLIEPPIGGPFAFVNPFVLDLNNADIMYFTAGANVIRSTNVSSATPPTWQTLSNATTGNNVTALSISKTIANRLYVGTDSNEILKIDGANTGDPVAVDISAGLPMGYVNCIYVDPANADNIIAVLSNYSVISLWSSNDGGSNWTNISGNLEQNPDGSGNGPSCRWVTSVNANGTMKYFVATSTGLYSTSNLNGNATVWAQEGPNTIGNVVCTMVKGRDADDYVAVATHGKGVFSSTNATPVEGESTLPENYSLLQNYPNPFNPSTTISFSLPAAGEVKLSLFDALGSEVDVIAANDFSAGNHSINYNASNLPSGVYFYRIEAGSFVQSKKMILMK
ncbi:MAG: T9SS type A sorting domain-containing protein [Ignavibacteriaceae bacterium]|nr:T9SS type A sorting domain-containing protein [Ignavibacteriaceae bacterium]